MTVFRFSYTLSNRASKHVDLGTQSMVFYVTGHGRIYGLV
jgi:hypothetical protein